MEKTILITIVLLAFFVFLVSFGTLYAQTHIVEGTACSCTLPIPLLIPALSSLGILVGSAVYYAMSVRMERMQEKRWTDRDAFIQMLEPDERVVISKLIKNSGKITQSSLSKELGKVKAFRVVERLRKRGIIRKERYGKTNIITFNDKFMRILFS